MDDQTRTRCGVDCPAEWYDDMGHERTGNDAAAPVLTAANPQTAASTTGEALIGTSAASWIDISSESLLHPSAAISISSSVQVAGQEECVAEVLQGACNSPSCDADKRRVDMGEQNEVLSTAEKGCSNTDCHSEPRYQSVAATGREPQGDCHGEAGERPARLFKKRAVPPNLQSLSENLRRYLESPMAGDPWLPKDLLQDPSVIPPWIIDVAEEEL